MRYLPYEEAKKAIQKMEDPPKTLSEYSEYAKSGLLPSKLPRDPYTYKGKGFVSIGDYLGTGVVAPQNKEYLSYSDAKLLVQSLNNPPRTEAEYRQQYKDGLIPKQLPAYPYSAYKNKGWVSMGDFLGTGRIATKNQQFMSYTEAKKAIQTLPNPPTTSSEYVKMYRDGALPERLPSGAPQFYKGIGWKGWGDFLGTGYIATQNRTYLSYDDSKEAIQNMEHPPKKQTEYFQYAKEGKLPNGVPRDPRTVNRSDWVGYGDFLGVKGLYSVSKSELRLRAEIESIFVMTPVERLEERNSALNELDIYIPEYGLAFEYDGAFWHTGKEDRDRRKNKLASERGIQIFRIRETARNRGMILPLTNNKTDVHYDVSDDLLDSIKSLLNKVYRFCGDRLPDIVNRSIIEYQNQECFIGDDRYHSLIDEFENRWLSYDDAKKAIQEMDVPPRTQPLFKKITLLGILPKGIPKDPYDYYRESGWISWGDFLGTGSVSTSKQKFFPLSEAKKAISLMKYPPKNRDEYQELASKNKLPEGVPHDPYNTYKNSKGWRGIGDFLGTGSIANQNMIFVSYQEAKILVSKMAHPPKSQAEYREQSKDGILPNGIPGSPQGVYKNSGWISWYDYLGTSPQDTKRTKDFLSYEEAKDVISRMANPPLTWADYREMAKKGVLPINLPKDPYYAYKNKGWKGVKDFLRIAP